LSPGWIRARGKAVIAVVAASLSTLVGAPAVFARNTNFLGGGGPPVDRIDMLFNVFLVISILVLVGVGGAILFAAVHFRRRSPDQMPKQVHGNSRVELIWTLIPAALLVVLFVLTAVNIGYIHSGPSPTSVAGRKAIHIKVIGQQFYWTFYYPNGKSSIRTLEIPVGVPIEISTESLDVIHGLWVPNLGAKIDALPGIVNHSFLEADKVGTDNGQCYEFCGVGHDTMLITVKVVTMSQYQTYVKHLASA
jgi:cytochrome c oxidase subunit 2